MFAIKIREESLSFVFTISVEVCQSHSLPCFWDKVNYIVSMSMLRSPHIYWWLESSENICEGISALISFKLLSYRMLKLSLRTYFLLCKTSHFWTFMNPRKLTMKSNHCRGFITLRFYSALKIKVNRLDMVTFSLISTLKSRK